ncbi:MAG: hypothetical protein AAGB31_01885 [Bdellovibrio sp.]
MRSFLLFSMLIVSTGCGLLPIQDERKDEAFLQREAEQSQMRAAEEILARAQFDQALVKFQEFQKKYPQSTFFQAARLGEAQALEGQGHYEEAAVLYRDVYLANINYQPNIAVIALYRSSFCYEAQGDDLKTLTALLDANKLGKHLPPEVAWAEIPARLASIYGRSGADREANRYLEMADKGLQKVRQEKGRDLKTDWLAKTYFQMGSVSTNQISAETFANYVAGQRWVQVYLIRALQQNDPVWSVRAQNKLEETYRDLYAQVELQKTSREALANLGGAFFDLMDQAELFRPVWGREANAYEKKFFSNLAETRKKTESLLYGSESSMGLTEESKLLNSIKRPGRVKVDSLLPEEKKSSIPLPSKVLTTEDPNL